MSQYVHSIVINLLIFPAAHQKYYITQYEELGFSQLMIILPILTSSLMCSVSEKGWENVTHVLTTFM